jgi:hypothetical protein
MKTLGAEAEVRIRDKPWTRAKIEGLVRGIDYAFEPMTGTLSAVDGDGWYGLKYHCLDGGKPDDLLDCIQLEQAVAAIKNPKIQLAVKLRMLMYSEEVIGKMCKSYLPGRVLVDQGIREIHQHELSRLQEREA